MLCASSLIIHVRMIDRKSGKNGIKNDISITDSKQFEMQVSVMQAYNCIVIVWHKKC